MRSPLRLCHEYGDFTMGGLRAPLKPALPMQESGTYPMNTLEAMQIFVRVAEHASFPRAAESLGLLKATVAVRDLESSLGTRLLHRTTRKVQMTLDGQVYYERCKELLSEVDNLQAMFQKSGEHLIAGDALQTDN
jgi:hypothetical protein